MSISQKGSSRFVRAYSLTKDPTKNYHLGGSYDCGSLLASGWGQPENGFVWSERNFAQMKIPVDAEKYQITLGVWGYAPGDSEPQNALIFSNGTLAGHYKVKEQFFVSFTCSQVTSEERELKVSIYIPNAESLNVAEQVPDDRTLGIALAPISVERIL